MVVEDDAACGQAGSVASTSGCDWVMLADTACLSAHTRPFRNRLQLSALSIAVVVVSL